MCRQCYDAAYQAAYRAAHPEQVRERHADYYAAHREQERERQAAYDAAHPERVRERQAAYRAAHPEKLRETERRRRERKAGYVVAVDHRDKQAPCGVCGGFIDHTLKSPNPMSAEEGHEPPLSRASEGVLRFEHRSCNRIKGNLTDAELLGRPDLLARLPGWDKGLAA